MLFGTAFAITLARSLQSVSIFYKSLQISRKYKVVK